MAMVLVYGNYLPVDGLFLYQLSILDSECSEGHIGFIMIFLVEAIIQY